MRNNDDALPTFLTTNTAKRMSLPGRQQAAPVQMFASYQRTLALADDSCPASTLTRQQVQSQLY